MIISSLCALKAAEHRLAQVTQQSPLQELQPEHPSLTMEVRLELPTSSGSWSDTDLKLALMWKSGPFYTVNQDVQREIAIEFTQFWVR